MDAERFALLVQGYLDHSLDAADRDALATALEQDPSLMDPFLDQVVVASGCGGGEDLERLRQCLDRASCQVDLQRLARSHRFHPRRIRWGIGMAAAAAVLLAVGLLALRPEATAGPERMLPAGLVLEGGNGPGPVRLRPGDRLIATTDIEALAWKPGVQMRLRSGTALAVPQDGDLQVTAGTLEATIIGPAPGALRLQVPGATLTDIGTRFAVAVDGAATTRPVSEGVIEVSAGGTRRQVTAGQVARLEAGRMALLPLTSRDLGHAPGLGRTVISHDRITLHSAATDPSPHLDGGHVLDRAVTGDWDAVVRIGTPVQPAGLRRAGLMVRATADPGSPFAACFLFPEEGPRLTVRTAVGHVRAWRSRPGPDRTLPTWLKLTRRGQRFTAYQSTDGTTWTAIGAYEMDLPSTVLAGLMVTSVADGITATAEFSWWTITPVP